MPDPGGPGRLFSPQLSTRSFAQPGAALRPKFRWWQPLADTDNTEIRNEVRTMANNGGGGFEQNGFPVNMNSAGMTQQFTTYANSQQFGSTYGWGSPLWSERTEAYQTAAARNGVIGDMNEGSRWNNTVPAVYSQNQTAAAKQLVFGQTQLQPGAKPGAELPPIVGNGGHGTVPGVSTTLTAPAKPGNTNLQLASIAGLLAGDQIALGVGQDAETATIKNVGTASPAVPLSQSAAAGDTVVHVPPATSSTSGSTTGVPGTGMLPAQFVAGENVTIGAGADREHATIKSVGTYDSTSPDLVSYVGNPTADWIWNTPNSDSSAAGGTVYLRKTFTTPPDLTRARLAINADDSHVTYVNGTQVTSGNSWRITQGVDITKELAPAGQQNVVAVAATNGSSAAGVIAAIELDGGAGKRIVSDKSWKAWPASTADPTVSSTPPASNWNTAGFDDSAWENAFSAGGCGVSPWGASACGGATILVLPPGGSGTVAAPAGATNVEVASTGEFLTGDTITIGVGAQAESRTITAVGVAGNGTTLSQAATAGDLGFRVASTTGLAAGNKIVIDPGQSDQQTVTIASISTAAAPHPNVLIQDATLDKDHASGQPVALGGIGLTFRPALSHSHDVGERAIDTGTGITLTRPLAKDHGTGETFMAPGTGVTLTAPLTKAHATGPNAAAQTTVAAPSDAGDTNLKVASTAGLAAGDTITVGSPGYTETATIKDVGSGGATGTGLTLTAGLKLAHLYNDPVGDASASGTNASAGLSDMAKTTLVAVAFAQCTGSGSSSCPSAATGGTRDLDPSSVQVVTGQVRNGALHYTSNGGVLPKGNGNPWEEIAFYQTADGQVLNGTSATTPNYWLDHLSATGAKAMADYYDNHILNNHATQAAIYYQDRHNGTPAVFEDSLEDSQNLKWTPGMLSEWKSLRGYNPITLLAAIAGENKNATSTPVFDFPQNDGHGASLGWRVREDYRQMWSDLYTTRYQPTLDKWATSHGMVTRFQAYGDPIDAGVAAAHTGIPEGEHMEFAGNDETQQFKVIASGMYQSGNKVVSDECCEEYGDIWADTFGLDGTGSGAQGSTILSNAQSVYADVAGGASQIVYHGWPYTTGVAGSSAVWPGYSYGGNASWSAANGPNQPQLTDDRQNNMDVARIALALRQGQASFDVAVYHQDLGLNGQGADQGPSRGENLGNRVTDGTTHTPTTGKLISSSSSLAHEGYTYGYVSPQFFRYRTAKYAASGNGGGHGHATGNRHGDKVLFPGHGNYKSLVIYDQSVMPPDVARKILALARQGLPVVIIGQLPDAAASAAPGTVSGMSEQDAKVQAAMTALTALPNVKVVSDASVVGGQSSDANAPAALSSLGITPAAAQTGVGGPWAIKDGALHARGGGIGLLQQGNSWTNYTMSFRTSLIAQQSGWVVRAQSADTAYLLILDGENDAVGPPNTLQEVVDQGGSYHTIDKVSLPFSVTPGTSYQVKTVVDGSRVSTSINGSQVASFDSSDLPAGVDALSTGTVGFREDSGGAEQASFQDLSVTAPDGASLFSSALDDVSDLDAFYVPVTSDPVLPVRRVAGDTSYYFLFNPNLSATVYPTFTLAGKGAPYLLNTWTGSATPIANYKSTSAHGDGVRLQVRLAPGNFKLIAVSTHDLARHGRGCRHACPAVHATSTTADATQAASENLVYTDRGRLAVRAATSGSYTTTLSNGKKVLSKITVPTVGASPGPVTLSDWRLAVDSWGPTASGDPTQTQHTRIPAHGALTVRPLDGVSDGSLPSWTVITPQNGFPVPDNLTNVAGVGTYTTTFTLPDGWSTHSDGAYVNLGVAVDTVDVWVNGKAVAGVDQNDRNQLDIGRYLRAGSNTMKITVSTPLRNAVRVASSVPATGQLPNSADPIGQLQGEGTAKEPNMGLIGPVTLTPYGQSLICSGHTHARHGCPSRPR